MLTISDIKKLTEVFVTKQEFNKRMENVATKDDFRKVMTTVDNVFGEVKAMREELAIHFQSHDDNRLEHKEFRVRLDKIE